LNTAAEPLTPRIDAAWQGVTPSPTLEK